MPEPEWHKKTTTAGDDNASQRVLKQTAHDSSRLVPGTPLLNGRFVIRRLLGAGGMGTVYEALDTERQLPVALKILSAVDAFGIYHLKQEFRALTDVMHPNLVGLHELFCDQGSWFFTMDLVPGDTLLHRLSAGSDWARLRRAFAQLATGIQAIHDAGKLHRDLKPSNVLLTPEDRIVILDFGLASDQQLGGVNQTLVDDTVSGTPAYMAPEQAAGEPASSASDWYAFGVILFEALTGSLPFKGAPHTVLMHKQQRDAPRPSSLREGIPKDLGQLCVQLLSRHPKARPVIGEILHVLGPVGARAESLPPAEDAPFVGRITELAALQDAFDATDKGLPVVVFVQGVSGVGKTTLVEQFLRQLRHKGEAVVVTGRCYERESVPYKACDSLIDALSRYIRQLPSEQAANVLPRHAHAIAHLFPALQRLPFMKRLRQRRSLPPDPNALRRMAFSALKELLANIAEQRPLALMVDDLQWSDVDGAKLLSSLLSPPEPPPLLLIGAYRTEQEDMSPGLATLREGIYGLQEAEVREIELGELSEQESRQLASDLLPQEIRDRAARIAEEAQGSPFFIAELARFAATGQAEAEQPTLEDAIGSRLGTLADAEREVFEAICVSARPMEQSLLRAVTATDDLASALRKLQSNRLIRYIAGPLGKVSSYHDRIRESVVAEMDAEYLELWHGKLAQALEASDSPDYVALTEHLLGASDWVKAGAAASQAADQAADALAFENAAGLYQTALELNPGDRENERQLQAKLGAALSNAGRGARAARALMKAAEGAQPEEEIGLRQLAAQQWLITGHIDEGTRELGSVLQRVGLQLHSSTLASILDLLVNRARIKIHGLHFDERTAEEVTERELLELRACRTAMQGLYTANTLQAAAFSSRLLWLALRSGMVEEIVKGLAVEAAYRSAEGMRNRPVVDDFLERAHQLSQRVQDPETLACVQYATGSASVMLGEFPRAIEHLKRAESIYVEKCTGVVHYLNAVKNFLGLCYSFLGSCRELQRTWDVWIKDGQERGDLFLLTTQQTWPMGTLRWLAADQVDRARDQLSQGLAQWPGKLFDFHQMFAAVSESTNHLYVGEYRQAFDVAKDLSRRFTKSPLRRVQLARVINRKCVAYASLGLASVTPDRKPLIKIAQREANKLAEERFPAASPYVAYVNGCLAHLKGDTEAAVELLSRAGREFRALQYALHAAATDWQLGTLLGGDEGRAATARAQTAMKDQDIANPGRIAALFAPGFGPAAQ